MTRLLVSVRNAEEARIALAGGAHLIDVKEPQRGPLGAADPASVASVVAAVAGRAPVSAALGELLDPLAARRCREVPACQFAKLALAGARSAPHWRRQWADALAQLPSGVAPIAVAYADASASDSPAPEEVLETGLQLGCAGLLVDTWDKRSGALLDHLDPVRLAALAVAARSAGLLFVAAGSLLPSHLPHVLRAAPDYVGVRGAVCVGGRTGPLDERLVRRLVADLARPPVERPFEELLAPP